MHGRLIFCTNGSTHWHLYVKLVDILHERLNVQALIRKAGHLMREYFPEFDSCRVKSLVRTALRTKASKPRTQRRASFEFQAEGSKRARTREVSQLARQRIANTWSSFELPRA